MAKIAYSNDTDQPQFFGGVMVPPGDTREIEETHLPSYRPEAAEATQHKAMHITDYLLAQSFVAILGALPSLCFEDVELLGEKEQKGAARKEILSAISERLLTESSQQLGGALLEDHKHTDLNEADRVAAELAETERLAAEKTEADRVAAELAEAERLATEKAEADRIAAEKVEADAKKAAEKAAPKGKNPK